VYHCTPPQFREVPWRDFADDLEMLSMESAVARHQAKAARARK